jgi:hypothetical protein
LLKDLDDPTDAARETSWLTEVQRRSRTLGEGMIQAAPAHEVFKRLRADLSK